MSIQILSIIDAPSSTFPAGVKRLEFRSAHDGQTDWSMIWPPDHGSAWAVVLHGHGSSGDQLFTRPDILRDWLPQLRERGFGIVSPNIRGNSWMSDAAADDLRGLLNFVRRDYGAARFHFVGGSMGGTSVLIYSVLHPDDVESIISICPATEVGGFVKWCRATREPPILQELAQAAQDARGGGPDDLPAIYASHSALAHARDRLTMPLYVAHGDADPVIPVEQARDLAKVMAGVATFKYREMPGGGHDAPLCAEVFEEGLEWTARRGG